MNRFVLLGFSLGTFSELVDEKTHTKNNVNIRFIRSVAQRPKTRSENETENLLISVDSFAI